MSQVELKLVKRSRLYPDERVTSESLMRITVKGCFRTMCLLLILMLPGIRMCRVADVNRRLSVNRKVRGRACNHCGDLVV